MLIGEAHDWRREAKAVPGIPAACVSLRVVQRSTLGGRLATAVFLLASGAPGLHAAASLDRIEADLSERIRPLLGKYCVHCHGPGTQTAGVDFTVFEDHASVLRARGVWERALRVLREGEMPPQGAQPSVEERQALVEWIDNAINNLDWSALRDPGSVTIPRLNRTEYNNTIRDLTGLDLRPADGFPADGQGESGFRNDRDGLFVAPVLAEKFLAAAEYVADELVAARGSHDPLNVRFEIEDFLRTETNQEFTEYGLDLRNFQQTVYRYVTFPRFARYRFRVRAWGESPVAGRVPGVTLRVAGRLVGQAHVLADPQSPQVYEFFGNIPRGSQRVSLHWFNPQTERTNENNRRLAAETKRLRAEAKAAGEKPPPAQVILSLDWIEVREDPQPGQDGSFVWIAEPGSGKAAADAAREVIGRFAVRAFRRPVRPAEVERLMGFYRGATARGEGFVTAVGLALRGVLVSPSFLFRPEQAPEPEAERPLNDYELASRLSYFLWMSMPDEELWAFARQGSLSDPATLQAQARRMLLDPRASAFVGEFFGQWLGYAELGGTIKPDDVEFPEFTPALSEAMLAEAELFFGRMVREDRSLLEIVDSEYSYLNEELARHYGIKGVVGPEMRLVEFDGPERGGVLGLGAVLTATSLPTRTSPVVRGKWVLETMLGQELPPPLPDAGDLPEGGKSSEGLTLRQIFERHRDEPRCAVCHDRIDPIGFGLENYDAIGRWRDTDNGQPVDAAGTLPGGESFSGPSGLKGILLERSEEFARMISERMLGFALGRQLEYFDRPAVDGIAEAFIRGGHRPLALIGAIIESYPFRYRRTPGEDPTEARLAPTAPSPSGGPGTQTSL